MKPSGIEPATFRFVAQHLNHCATAVPWSDECLTEKPTVSVGRPNRGMRAALIIITAARKIILQVSIFHVAHPDIFLPITLGVDVYCYTCSHSVTRTHSVGLLCQRDRPVAETCNSQHKIHNRQTSTPRRDSNPQSQQASGRKPTS